GARKVDQLSRAMKKAKTLDAAEVLDVRGALEFYGLPPALPAKFLNHHASHAMPSLFFTDWEDALLYTADAAGDNVNYSHRVLEHGAMTCLYGDDRWLNGTYSHESVARGYWYVTEALGFRPFHHEGKITGLAAFGKPVLLEQFAKPFHIEEGGRIVSDFTDGQALRDHFMKPCAGQSREDCAASIQAFTEEIVLASVRRLLERHKVKRLGLAGGLFANVKLNQRLAEQCDLQEVFVVPPMGDEGLVIGGALQYLLERDGLETWLRQRRRLDDVYWGREYPDAGARFLRFSPEIERLPGDPVETAAGLMAQGKAVAIFTKRMEYGPRALGARSIMASPERRDINDSLNKRLDRSEFMPFAPVVAEEDARAVFEVSNTNAYACRFMTITCGVKPEWKERIPAVVHVDGTARPQIIRRAENPLYYDTLKAFKARTGLPAAINTSFNVHEEPIINTPEEAAEALVDNRVDYLLAEDGVFGVKGR
ncbi:MAG TPA: carbamoyltransferase C-terminal domain-containing protein, partial [Stellaceae bacterium]|nr:carbamoyltransferase C-terminal domain-containing protein [Stellaceae bacterium]